MNSAAGKPGTLPDVLLSRHPCDASDHAPPRLPPDLHKRCAWSQHDVHQSLSTPPSDSTGSITPLVHLPDPVDYPP